jgi:hypothetical protein
MVQFAKSVALNIDDQAAVAGWRRQNQSVSTGQRVCSGHHETLVANHERINLMWDDCSALMQITYGLLLYLIPANKQHVFST